MRCCGVGYFANRFSKINASISIKNYPPKSGINCILLLTLCTFTLHAVIDVLEVDCVRIFIKKLLSDKMKPLFSQAKRLQAG